MLFVIDPISLIVSTVGVLVGSMSVGFVVNPLALIDISISMYKFPVTIGLVILPVTLIPRSVRPNLRSCSISLILEPLSAVGGTVLKMNGAMCEPPLGITIVQRLAISQLLHDSLVEARAELETLGWRIA